MTTSKNHENYWKVDFQIDILEEACETASHIVNCHRTACMPAHAHKCMHMRFARWAMLGSLFPNIACPNSDTWRVRIQIFFFFFFFFSSFFLRVSQMSFLKLRVTRATRAFYTGEKSGSWPWRHYLETNPDPIAMVIRVKLFTHKPSETNTNWHCMVTHARLFYRCLQSAELVDQWLDSNYHGNWVWVCFKIIPPGYLLITSSLLS